MKALDFGEELNTLIPAEVEILIGKSREKARKITLYPYSLSDLRRVSMMVEKLVGLLFKKEKKETDKEDSIEDFVQNNLDKVARIISVATFSPDAGKYTEEELNKKTNEIMEELTLKQMIFGFQKVMEVNDTSFLVSGVMNLVKGISQPLAEQTSKKKS